MIHCGWLLFWDPSSEDGSVIWFVTYLIRSTRLVSSGLGLKSVNVVLVDKNEQKKKKKKHEVTKRGSLNRL